MTDITIASGLLGAGVGLLFLRIAAVERRLASIVRIEAKLDALLEANQVKFDPCADLPADVRAALSEGRHVLAVKRLREATGLGLKDAHEAITTARTKTGRVRS